MDKVGVKRKDVTGIRWGKGEECNADKEGVKRKDVTGIRRG